MNAHPCILDDLPGLLEPGALLRHPRATGEGVRLAVIDSGIDLPWLESRHPTLAPIQRMAIRNHKLIADWNTPPLSTHGTVVADIILSLAPKTTLVSIDVFGTAGQCSVEDLERAIRGAVHEAQAKVVNLSLGVPEQRLKTPQQRRMLQAAVDEAYFADVLLVAAANNDHPITRSYPAAFAASLFSVDKALMDDPLACIYRLRDQVEFQAHGRGYLGWFAREPATSWAAPHLSAIAARLLTLKPSLKLFELKTILYWMQQAHARASP